MSNPRAQRWIGGCLLVVGLAGFAFALGVRRWRQGVTVEHWPVLEHLELDLDLSRPPELQAGARLELSGVHGRWVPLLLNRDLDLLGVKSAEGVELGRRSSRRLRSRHHREGRVHFLDLGEAPPDGRARIHLSYAGRGLDGSEGRDWRGVLLVAADELRMSEQTIFHPQVPRSSDGPGAASSTARVRVLAPADFEVFVPGAACAEPVLEGDARRWCFELARPGTLAVLGGPRHRTESEHAGGRVISLLSDQNRHLAGELAERALAALEAYASWWGRTAGGTLGIVEIFGRGSSYNWAQQGVVTIDHLALGNGVPPEKLAHEVAHLWWGQRVGGRGAGERFLTESLAEYASWRLIEAERGAAAASELARAAREQWLDAVHAAGHDPALAEVGFDTPGYQALVYAKGPLVLRALEAQLGRAVLDRALRDYAERGSREGGTLELLEECLRRAAGNATFDLPWLREAGHAHLALAGSEHDPASGRARVRVLAEDCPAGLPRLLPPGVPLELRARGAAGPITRRIVASAGSLPGTVELELPVEPAWIALDPELTALCPRTPPLAPGSGRLLASDPPEGARELPLGRFDLRLSFDVALAPLEESMLERIRRATVSAALAAQATIPSVVEVGLEEGGRVLRLALERTLPGREHLVALPTELEDQDGIPLGPLELRFTTRDAEGLARPRIVASAPEKGATGVPLDLDVIRVVFSHPMRESSGFSKADIAAHARAGREYPSLEFARWIDPLTAEIPLKRALEPATTYALPFRASFRDEQGLPLEDFDLVFTTGGVGR